jgi:hypothetical protein
MFMWQNVKENVFFDRPKSQIVLQFSPLVFFAPQFYAHYYYASTSPVRYPEDWEDPSKLSLPSSNEFAFPDSLFLLAHSPRQK